MGSNKLGDGNKDYAAGYAAGFAEGIAAGFAATSEVSLNPLSPDSNVKESAMNSNTAGTVSSDHSTVTDEDLNLLYPSSHTLESSTGAIKADKVNAQPSTVSEEEIGHLAPGCFVQVGFGDSSYWVEIGQIEGGTISGIVHPELSGTLCVINHDSCEIARFTRDQITALGCDRYCWC
jgi:hypothetical protein